MPDAFIIGCGLTGAVIARHLAEQGKHVVIFERRNHIAGNMYDYVDEYGILVHKYGPHTFHTNKEYLYKYISKVIAWDEYHLKCGAQINGKCTPTPFNFKTIDDFYSPNDAQKLKKHLQHAFGTQTTATVIEVLNHPDPIINDYAHFLFKKDYSLYTAKQWGVSPHEINPSILKRVPLRFSYNEGYFDDTFQVMPHTSYTNFFEKLLDSSKITVKLKTDALQHFRIKNNKLFLDDVETHLPVIYTGALDELFSCCEGPLPYRSLHFKWEHKENDSFQDYPVVAYPQAKGYTRITEYKKLPVQKIHGTSYAIEYPLQYNKSNGHDPYYPLLTNNSQKRYNLYQKKAKLIKNLYPCGRLADFQYYNMDQALSNALNFCNRFFPSTH